jgi:glutamate N-acetyltransferase/amino-acid N-acetyltransferase
MTNDFEIHFDNNGGVVSAAGFVAGAARGELKTAGDDIVLIASETPATCAAVFTRNLVKAAPVEVCAAHAQNTFVRAIVANAGNANCCTGTQGLADAHEMCELAAQKLGCPGEEILVCSTGIIGHQMPMDKIGNGIAAVELSRTPEQNERLARAIMTTDTRPKFCAASTFVDGKKVTVGGTVKGAGMIGPDMSSYAPSALHATLLSFITTDAQIEKQLLQNELERAIEKSYNSVTIDGDTSTNDTALVLANGASGVLFDEGNIKVFRALLESVVTQLAREVARDGEGATRLVTVKVLCARDEAQAKVAAMTIANSPLVSTAIFGGDPNWGRIAAAAGRSGAQFDAAKLQIKIGDVEVFRNGEPTQFELAQAEAALQKEEVILEISLGAGAANWTAWTCDFSYDYVKINAEYHT